MLLNLGSGVHPAPAPWCNVDCVPQERVDVLADVAQLPFADRAATRILACHLLEHIPIAELPRVLGEWHRVLRPGGVLCVVGPDIDRARATGQPQWLLDDIAVHGSGPQGHAWEQSEARLVELLSACSWDVEAVDVGAIIPPAWPNPSTAEWQCAALCWAA